MLQHKPREPKYRPGDEVTVKDELDPVTAELTGTIYTICGCIVLDPATNKYRYGLKPPKEDAKKESEDDQQRPTAEESEEESEDNQEHPERMEGEDNLEHHKKV
jgi:hypothetical protein